MIKKFSDIQDEATRFLIGLFDQTEAAGVKIEPHWNIDHLCFRTATDESYLEYKSEFSKFAKLLIESEVNGRLISTFKLPESIYFKKWNIDLIELPAPKKGKVAIEGFEHIEIVVDLPLNQIKSMYPSCQFDEGGMKKDFNQELEIIFGSSAIKFHSLSLESVVNVEKNSQLFKALTGLGILNEFKEFNPLVSGTFPLDISTPSSDVDVLMSSSDLNTLEAKIKTKYQNFESFKCVRNGWITAEFKFEGFVFEIYAEEKLTALQNSNLHFLLQERLLKLGSSDFKNLIIQLKQSGLKTEPAFAKALNLSGDPYQALIDIRKKSDSELAILLR